MSTKYIERRHDAARVATGSHAGIGVEYSTNKIYVKPAPGVDRVELVDTTSVQTLTNKTVDGLEVTNPHFIGDLILEGTTEDAFETTLRSEATADVVVTLPDATDTLVGKATTDTLTNKTLTAPVLTGPTGTGFTRTAIANFVEDATSTSHVATIPIPAGSIIEAIDWQNRAAWVETNLITTAGWTVGAGWTESPDETFTHAGGGGTAALTHSATIVAGRVYTIVVTNTGGTAGDVTVSLGGVSNLFNGNDAPSTFVYTVTALNTTGLAITPTTLYDGAISGVEVVFGARLDIGDTADPNGYVANEMQSGAAMGFNNALTLGGGAYCPNEVSVGPTSSNFGPNYVAGSNIIATITNPVPSVTAGRTTLVVRYTVPAAVTPVLT